MTTTGREVASGTLWMTRGESVKVRVRVAARCGTPDCSHQGQIVIYEESSSLGGDAGVSDKPTRILLLSKVSEVSSLNGNLPTTPTNASPPIFGLSLDGRSPLSRSSLWGLMLLIETGEAVELFAETREQQQQWIQYLSLLSRFPFSPIPEEPRINPIRGSLRTKLKLSNYDADSVWVVYVLAEEVGSRIQSLGVHIVTLKSSLSKESPAQMSIISPLDMEPIVTWDANKMRRTGCLGNMVFIEIGRRCEGGPGLIWMYACPEDASDFRETLKRFLFIGDGRQAAVTGGLPTESKSMYDQVQEGKNVNTARWSISSTGSSPCSSGGSSFRLSYNCPAPPIVKKSAEYDSADVDEVTYDYAVMTGPNDGRRSQHVKSSTLPLSSTPPPINLISHPSRKNEVSHKRTLSNPGTQNRVGEDHGKQNDKTLEKKTHGGSIDSGMASTVSLDDDFQSIDESLSMIMNDLNETCQGSEAGQKKNGEVLDDLISELEDFASDKSSTSGSCTPSVKRSNTLPSGNKKPDFKRANSTSTCHPTHYMKMRNPKADLAEDGYVIMVSAGRNVLDKVPEENSTSSSTTTTTTTTTSSVKKGPIARINYDKLELQSNPSSSETCKPSTDYVNHPLPPEIARGTPVLYQREYGNITHGNQAEHLDLVDEGNFEEEAIYMNHDQPPTTKNEMAELFSSTWDEINNLQQVLDQIGDV